MTIGDLVLCACQESRCAHSEGRKANCGHRQLNEDPFKKSDCEQENEDKWENGRANQVAGMNRTEHPSEDTNPSLLQKVMRELRARPQPLKVAAESALGTRNMIVCTGFVHALVPKDLQHHLVNLLIALDLVKFACVACTYLNVIVHTIPNQERGSSEELPLPESAR